jgi:hypothetical protein
MFCLASSPDLHGRSSSSHVLQTGHSQSTVFLDVFMTPRASTPLVPEATQAETMLALGPTMVLFETQGLQLYLVMRGGIW